MSDVKRERRDRWAEALRSGEFEQNTGALRVNDKYCCLGVACELYRRETGEGRWTTEDYFWIDGEARNDLLPARVAKYFGVDRSSSFHEDGHEDQLSGLNDDGLPFDAIADVIEREPEGLVVR